MPDFYSASIEVVTKMNAPEFNTIKWHYSCTELPLYNTALKYNINKN